MEQITFRTWEDLDTVRSIMRDKKNEEDIAVIFDERSTKILNVQAIADEINYVRIKEGYDISQYGFTSPDSNTFGYMYTKREF